MNFLKQVFQWAERTLTARDYIQFVLIVLLVIAYLNRSDKKEAEVALRKYQEQARLDRIRSDSICDARQDERDLYWQAKFDARTEEYIKSLRGIKDTVQIAVGTVKKAIAGRDQSQREVESKVSRNGRELDSINKRNR